MSRKSDRARVLCPRARGGHTLARRGFADGEWFVVAQVVALTAEGYRILEHTYLEADLTDIDGDRLASLVIQTGCSCGKFDVDVAALLRRGEIVRRQYPLSATDERQYGIPPERRRDKEH